jgi:hypothetical protein
MNEAVGLVLRVIKEGFCRECRIECLFQGVGLESP